MPDINEVLGMLQSVLFPSGEAGAASAPTDPRIAAQLQQQRMQQQLQQQLVLEQTRQQDPLRLAQADATRVKAQVPDIASVLQQAQPQQAQRPEMPITFGQNPRTGGYSFNNLGFVTPPDGATQLPDFATQGRAGEVAKQLSTPQAAQDVAAAKQDQQQFDTSQPAGGNVQLQAIARAKMAAQLKGKVPDKELERALDAMFPPAAATPGEDVLQGVDPGTAALVKKVANYEIPIAGFGGMDAKTRAKVLPLVAQYDPTFDATQYNARMKLRQDFTSGKSAQAIRSLNTVIQHMDSLDKAAAGLDNSQWQLWNYAANKGREASGDPRVDKFNTAATAVEDELSAVFKATGSTDTSIKQWKDRLSASKSPEQYKGIIQEAVNLLDGRMQAIQGTWNQGMGGKELPKPLLTPKAQATLDRLRTGESTVAPTNQPTTQVAAPASSEGKPTGRTSGGKPVFVRPNGTFFVQD